MSDAVKESVTKRFAVFQQLHAAQESLHRLVVLLLAAGDGGGGAGLVRGHAAAARGQLDEAVRLLAQGGEPTPVARVPCSFCGQMIMPAATLCGSCWRKRTPTTG
jgi:hypothetical protein